jgi:Kelch motif
LDDESSPAPTTRRARSGEPGRPALRRRWVRPPRRGHQLGGCLRSQAGHTWRSVAPMPTTRERLRLVASGRYLYAIGGAAPTGESLTTVERYAPKSDSWTTMNPMVESRVLPCAVETRVGRQRVLVVVGGFEFSADGTFVQARRTTEVFDPHTGRWTLLDVLLRRCCIERSPRSAASTRPPKQSRLWARSHVPSRFLVPPRGRASTPPGLADTVGLNATVPGPVWLPVLFVRTLEAIDLTQPVLVTAPRSQLGLQSCHRRRPTRKAVAPTSRPPAGR